MRLIKEVRSDWRGYVARRLLSLAYAIDKDCKVMCDAAAGWKFQRGWQQSTSSFDFAALQSLRKQPSEGLY